MGSKKAQQNWMFQLESVCILSALSMSVYVLEKGKGAEENYDHIDDTVRWPTR